MFPSAVCVSDYFCSIHSCEYNTAIRALNISTVLFVIWSSSEITLPFWLLCGVHETSITGLLISCILFSGSHNIKQSMWNWGVWRTLLLRALQPLRPTEDFLTQVFVRSRQGIQEKKKCCTWLELDGFSFRSWIITSSFSHGVPWPCLSSTG